MASEYLKYLARNEKPREEYVMTPEERRKNWWYYNKWKVIAGVLAVVIAISMIYDVIHSKRTAPDYQIAYVGSLMLPENTVSALENSLAGFGRDLTGDGEVRIMLRQYLPGDDQVTATQMMVDMATGESSFFLLEDPEDFLQQFQVLSYADGTYSDGQRREEPLYYLWSELPALTALDLGNYLEGREGISAEEMAQGDNQKLLSGFYVGRRGNRGEDRAQADDLMWQQILSGLN